MLLATLAPLTLHELSETLTKYFKVLQLCSPSLAGCATAALTTAETELCNKENGHFLTVYDNIAYSISVGVGY